MTKYPLFQNLLNTINIVRPDWHKEIEGIENNFQIVKNGNEVTLNKHIEVLVLSLLSSERKWVQVEPHILNGDIKKAFLNYDAEKLITIDFSVLLENVTNIKCGHRMIKLQMQGLARNIQILKRMYQENMFDIQHGYYGHTHFADGKPNIKGIIELVFLLAEGKDKNINNANEYKLRGAGIPLVCEYIKGFGVNVIKPDRHVRRILGRLGYHTVNYSNEKFKSTKWAKIEDAILVCDEIAHEYNLSAAEVDTVLWQYCLEKKANVCTEHPQCEKCNARNGCIFYIERE